MWTSGKGRRKNARIREKGLRRKVSVWEQEKKKKERERERPQQHWKSRDYSNEVVQLIKQRPLCKMSLLRILIFFLLVSSTLPPPPLPPPVILFAHFPFSVASSKLQLEICSSYFGVSLFCYPSEAFKHTSLPKRSWVAKNKPEELKKTWERKCSEDEKVFPCHFLLSISISVLFCQSFSLTFSGRI